MRSGGATPIPTNAWTPTGIRQFRYRFIMCPTFAPIIRRGVQKIIQECVEPFHTCQTGQEDHAKIISLNLAKRPRMEPKHRTRTQA